MARWEIKNVNKVLKELRYNGSFGIRGPRKTDYILSEEVVEKSEDLESLTA